MHVCIHAAVCNIHAAYLQHTHTKHATYTRAAYMKLHAACATDMQHTCNIHAACVQHAPYKQLECNNRATYMQQHMLQLATAYFEPNSNGAA